MSPAARALERCHREDGPALLAGLARELRSLDLAEEALADAQVAALRQWPAEGVPGNPAGWLRTVARRRARDRLRREATLRRKLPLLVVDPPAGAPEPVGPVADDRLRLLFCVCHPALSPQAQVALCLRLVAGLPTAEVARLFLVAEPAMAARITRAKRKVAEAGIPFRVPPPTELPARLGGVLATAYLVFTAGYAPADGERLVRLELCAEALRLARLVRGLLPADPEAAGLLALLLLQHARRDARVRDGRLVRLADQDRALWRRDELAEGLALLAAAGGGRYALEAAIAAEHALAPDAASTDWRAIGRRYAALEALRPSPAVRLNRAVAVAEAEGPAAGLALLEGLDAALPRSHALHAARAELHLRTGDRAAAAAALDRALALAGNAVVRAHLAERRAALSSAAA